LHVKDKLRRLK